MRSSEEASTPIGDESCDEFQTCDEKRCIPSMGLTAPWGAAARRWERVQLMRHCPAFPPIRVFRAELSFVFYFQLVMDSPYGPWWLAYRRCVAQNWDIFLQAFAQYPKVCTICD
jgi:hypothetical protein